MFEDEFGLSNAESVSFTWAPKGQPPLFKRIFTYRRETLTTGRFDDLGKIFIRHFDGSLNAEKLIIGPDHLQRQIHRPMTLIWDRSPVHRAKIVTAYLKQHPEFIKRTCQGMHRNSIRKNTAMRTSNDG